MNLWDIKAKLYRSFRYKSVFGKILDKENDNLRDLFTLIPVDPKKIIDLGCGDGNVLSLTAEHFPDARIFGLDLNRQMLNYAKKRGSFLFIQGDAFSLPIKNHSLDLCILTGLMEYINHKDLILKNLQNILIEQGYAVITFSPKNILSYLRMIYGIKIYPDSEKQIIKYIKKNGFAVISAKKSVLQKQYLIKRV